MPEIDSVEDSEIIGVMARPSKFDLKFCDQLIKHCSQGYSFESFAHKIGVSERTLRNWRDTYSVFADAHDQAKSAALHFYEKLLVQTLNGRRKTQSKQSASLLIFTLKTRFSAIYRQPVSTDQAASTVDPPGTFEFKGRKVTVAELHGEELAEAERYLDQKIKDVEARIERIRSPNPFLEN